MNDTIYRQAAIDALRNIRAIKGSSDDEILLIDKAEAQTELMMLPSAQPEQRNCCYCNEDSDGYVKPIEKNAHAFIRFGVNGWTLSLRAKGWHGEAKINYCPMCGRKLKNDK